MHEILFKVQIIPANKRGEPLSSTGLVYTNLAYHVFIQHGVNIPNLQDGNKTIFDLKCGHT